MYLDSTYFIGELALPNVTNTITGLNPSHMAGNKSLDYFIAKYEREFLIKVLGFELFEEFTAGLKENPIPEKWQRLKDKLYWQGGSFKFSPAANYVYFYAKNDFKTNTTPAGEVREEVDFAKSADEATKLIKAWNDMAKYMESFNEYMCKNEDYPKFKAYCFSLLNPFNI